MPDDQRPRTPAAGSSEDPESDADAGGDDLEALAGALPSIAAGDAPPDGDEELDLGALAAVGGQRPSTQPGEGDGRLSLAGADAAASASDAARAPVVSSAAPRSEPDAPARIDARPSGAPAEAPRARPTWLVPLLLGLGIGAGVAAAAFMATSNQPPPSEGAAAIAAAPSDPSPARGDDPVAGARPDSLAADGPSAPAVGPQVAVADEAAPAAAAGPANANEPRRAGASAGSPRKPAPAAVGAGAPSETPAPASASTDVPAVQPVAGDPLADDKGAAPDANAKTSSVDALLDEALSPAAQRNELARRQQAALEAQQLPLTPSKDDVTQAMTVLLPAIRGCAMGQSGLATASIVVRADGRVAGVEIAGAPFAGTPSGRCMEGVIRRARFTPFRQPVLRIKFPLAIQ
jgi:hypothetical protein